MTSNELGSRRMPPATTIGDEVGDHDDDRERFRTPAKIELLSDRDMARAITHCHTSFYPKIT